MRPFYFFLFIPVLPFATTAQNPCEVNQAETVFQVNNIKTYLQAGADLWWNRSDSSFLILEGEPNQEPLSLNFIGGVWMGGLDPGGNLKVAAQTYGAAIGNEDFWPGPLTLTEGITYNSVCENFDKLWKVNRPAINAHIADFESDGDIDGPVSFSILAWPGRKNPQSVNTNGFALPSQPLAPFEDRNGNSVYEPLLGDYPKVKGDQAVWWVFNDHGGGSVHGETKGDPLQIEVQVLAYAYMGENDENLFNTTFYEFTIYNRAIEAIDSVFFSIWVDPDLGCYEKDYVGCNPGKRTAYAYNNYGAVGGPDCCSSTPSPECAISPIMGVKVLKGPIGETGEDVGFSSFMVYNNPSWNSPPPGTTDPETPLEYFYYMSGSWKDGLGPTFGGDGYNPAATEIINYLFSDNPSDSTGWSLCTENLPVYDRRMLINSGPFNLLPGEKNTISYAVITFLDADYPCPDITPLLEMGDAIQDFYDELTDVEDSDEDSPQVQSFPNPLHTEGKLSVKNTGQTMRQVRLFSADGRLVSFYDDLQSNELTIQRNGLPDGIYFYVILLEDGRWSAGKIVMQ